MSKKKSTDQTEQASGPRRAADFLAAENQRHPPRPMFDAFWREGELALMFGPAGVGKSLLAVQVADAIARGHPIEGFEMAVSRRKVLYVDLKHSDRQFAERYSYRTPVSSLGSVRKACKFAENLYRSRPPQEEELCEWLARQIREHGFNVVIVDDLTALKTTHDGVKETLAVMRKLKKLCDDMRASVLAIMGTDEPRSGKAVSENDLKRSSVLCGVADSVFAIALGRCSQGHRHIFQTRSRNAALDWTVHNAPLARIVRSETGWPGFVFDERFAAPIDPEMRDAICRIRAMRQAGKTWRAIEAELEISKTRAVRLFKKWTPEMGGEEFAAEYEPPTAECGVQTAELKSDDEAALSNAIDITPPEPEPEQIDSPAVNSHSAIRTPQLKHGPDRVALHDLTRGTNGAGEEIFIESVEEHTRKPNIWYKRDRHGNTVKFVRDDWGSTATKLGPSAFL